jgi:hypothetical protein
MKNYEKFLSLGQKLHSSASASVKTAIPRFASASAKFNLAFPWPWPWSKIVPRSIPKFFGTHYPWKNVSKIAYHV